MTIEPIQDLSQSRTSETQEQGFVPAAPSYFSVVAEFFYSFFRAIAPTPPLESARVTVKTTAPFFFKITGRDIPASQPVYILGIHSTLTFQELPAEVIERIYACDVLICATPSPAEGKSQAQERFAQFIREMQQQYHEPDTAQLKNRMDVLGFPDDYQDCLIKELAGRIQEFKAWGPYWMSRLSARTREKLEHVLGEYGLKLSELHPLLVKAILMHRVGLPKSKTFENEVIQYFKNQQKNIKWIESIPEFSQDFEFIVSDWESVFNVSATLSMFEKMSVSLDSLHTGVKSTYDDYATGKQKWDLKKFKIEDGHDLVEIRAKSLWNDQVEKTVPLKQSAVIVVPYEMLGGNLGLLSCLESFKGYHIEKL